MPLTNSETVLNREYTIYRNDSVLKIYDTQRRDEIGKKFKMDLVFSKNQEMRNYNF